MYRHCLFCSSDLGSNEVLESFPVGRRLAFDAERGRLWVICRRCERWNLTPLEERWEAVERAEGLFRETPTRVSTEQIGLARLREGLELVRSGAPPRAEFAAWRYGDQFGRRRRRTLTLGAAGTRGGPGTRGGGCARGLLRSGRETGPAGGVGRRARADAPEGDAVPARGAARPLPPPVELAPGRLELVARVPAAPENEYRRGAVTSVSSENILCF